MGESICRVTSEVIDPSTLLAGATSEVDGAALLFLGVVRNHNEGRSVGHLDYHAYPAMAEQTLREIVGEARAQYRITTLSVVHRIGRLEIGEVSVAIAVSSPHRGDSFGAARHVIEELKKRVPIWKREGYTEGESEWLRGTSPPIGAEPG